MKKGKTDWIVEGGEGALCLRCRETEKIPIPMPVEAFGKWCEYFIEKHRLCNEKARIKAEADAKEAARIQTR